MKLEQEKPKRRASPVLGAIVVLLHVLIIAMLWKATCAHQADNETCDTKCRTMKYPAGEYVPWMKHRVCVCWPPSAEPPAYFLLRRH
jgi:hypothetical protein